MSTACSRVEPKRLPFSVFLAMGTGFSIWVLPNLTLWAAHGAGAEAGELSLYNVGGSMPGTVTPKWVRVASRGLDNTKVGEGWLLWP